MTQTHINGSDTRVHRRRLAVKVVVCAFAMYCALYAADARAEKSVKKEKKNEQNAPVFFPQPPDPPRIQFLRSFKGEKDMQRKASGFKKFIVGEDEDKSDEIGKAFGVLRLGVGLHPCQTGVILRLHGNVPTLKRLVDENHCRSLPGARVLGITRD